MEGAGVRIPMCLPLMVKEMRCREGVLSDEHVPPLCHRQSSRATAGR